MNYIKRLITGLIIAALVFLPALAYGQVVDDIEDNTNTDVNVTDNSDNSDNSQDNDPIDVNVSENQVVIVYCYVDNTVEDSGNSGQEAEDVDTEQEVEVEDNTLNDNNTLGDLVATQTTTLDQEASVVASFEQRGCDVHVEYKTNPDPVPTTVVPTVVVPTPIIVTNTVTNNTETVKTVTVERAVNLPNSPPRTGGN